MLALEDGPLLSEAAALGARSDVLPLPRVLASLGESARGRDGHGLWLQTPRATVALARWLPRFAALLRSKKPDLLHSNGLKTHLLAALVKPSGAALVWHLHDFLSERRLTARLLPLLQRQASLGVAVSKAVAEDARKVLGQMRVETVLNGVRTDLFTPGRVPPIDLDALAGLTPAPTGTLRIGLVATYASWKGHHLFLEAARRVTSPTVRFYIVGGPVYSTVGSQVTLAELSESIARLRLESQCGLVPFQRNVAAVYAALDIVVQASTRREPFGRTVAEAMASGRAVVAGAAGGALEQIEHGVSGLRFTPGDPSSLSEQMGVLISAPEFRARMQDQALSRARSHLDAARLGGTMIRIYHSLCGQG